MYCKPVLDFFLGALSPSGFTGWFAQSAGEPGVTPYLIKSGPGCGKSTLMRRLGEREIEEGPRDGRAVERIHCSSDPNSLDGVFLPGAHALVLDATAPHTLDCKYPDAAERVISLYETLDHAALRGHREEILALGHRNSFLLQQASAHYALACALLARRRALAAQVVNTDKVDRFTSRLAARTMPRRRGVKDGVQRHRLLSAPTPGGTTVFYDTIPQLAKQALYAIHDPYGAVSARMLAQLARAAKVNGYDAILCHCPSDQANKLDALFVPSLGLGFVTANTWHPMLFADQKSIHASRFMEMQALEKDRRALRFQKRLAGELIEKACAAQTEAKAVHDELEAYYIAAVDFEAVDRVRSRLEEELFGK